MREPNPVKVGDGSKAIGSDGLNAAQREELADALLGAVAAVDKRIEQSADRHAWLARGAARYPVLNLTQNLRLDLGLVAILGDGAHNLDGHRPAHLLIPHLDNTAKCALSELPLYDIPAIVKAVAHTHHIVPLCPLLLLTVGAGTARRGRGAGLLLQRAAMRGAPLVRWRAAA
eukprot:scaffold79434_cov32-Tisochrysis_lutea.AAC.5